MPASSVRWPRTICSSNTRPSGSSMRRIQNGSCRTPPVANVPNAEAISRGLTPEVPSASEYTGVKSLLIPQRRATSINASGPTRSTSWAAIALTLFMSACFKIMGPSYSRPKFLGLQSLAPLTGIVMALSTKTLAGVKSSFSNAA